MVKKTKKQILSTATKLTTELFALIGITYQELNIIWDDTDRINMVVKTDSPGMLIGYRGETLNSLQLILSIMIYKNTGVWQKLVVDINDYRQQREAALNQLADNTAKRVIENKKEETILYLNAAERRIIHMALAENKLVATESRGTGKDRQIVIMPKTSLDEQPKSKKST